MRDGFGHTSQVSSSNDSDNPVAGLSELEVALLGLLSIRPMTGYEIEALAALRRFGSDGARASAEQASDLLDAIRDVS